MISLYMIIQLDLAKSLDAKNNVFIANDYRIDCLHRKQ